ncbi:hypothetical protein STCU_00865 [Strigomonas culicis]|uniref:Uncharacterized protein n=1 Tax=Strigomonas culicis TaxID=28005 RepID=S9WIZ4_9TRYP|nr:hypothetical protein STCU_00865 [Strigomonas culicis]|eukprot:EPY35880.1 hypothetical protein STCU_00865 [Strigomonas culicis]
MITKFRKLMQSDIFPLVLTVLTLLGCFACGTLTLFFFITHRFRSIRFFCAYLYNLVLTTVLPAAEVGMMTHPTLRQPVRFMQSNVGRGLLLIFMGGVVCDNTVEGWIVASYLFAVGVLSMIAVCVMRRNYAEKEGA